MSEITGYHAHVYFNEHTFSEASALCDLAGELFPVSVGRKHQQPVGPHPMWSCQLAFAPETFGKIIPWLTLHRNGLTVFIHPETGDDLKDHTDHALWMGSMETLRLDMFSL
jgi:aromatic ring-cleaving dioxygenase